MQLKREALARKYSSTYVAKLTDAQVYSIYMRLLSAGKLS